MPEFEVKQEDAVRAGRSSGPAGRGTTLRAWFADVKREVDAKPKPAWLLRLEPQVDELDRRAGVGFCTVIGLIIGAFVFGTPHILTTYECSGSCRSSYAREYDCHYVGITGGKRAAPVNDKCPGFRLL